MSFSSEKKFIKLSISITRERKKTKILSVFGSIEVLQKFLTST